MNVMVKEPGKAWHLEEIENTLGALQKLVDGSIECHIIGKSRDHAVICNEYGRILKLDPNVVVHGVPYVGTVALVGVDEEDFCDIRPVLGDLLDGTNMGAIT